MYYFIDKPNKKFAWHPFVEEMEAIGKAILTALENVKLKFS
jgi:hypothetical protein